MTAQRKRGATAATAEQEWLTLAQVAALYGVTGRRVRQMVTEGLIEGVRFGRHWKVSRRWLDAQHQRSGGVFPSAEGKGLVGFYGQAIGQIEEDEFWARWRQEARRVLLEEWPAVLAEFAALPARLSAARDGELADKRRKTG